MNESSNLIMRQLARNKTESLFFANDYTSNLILALDVLNPRETRDEERGIRRLAFLTVFTSNLDVESG